MPPRPNRDVSDELDAWVWRLRRKFPEMRPPPKPPKPRKEGKGKAPPVGKSGHRGVYQNRHGRFVATINFMRERVNAGTYATLDEAIAARAAKLRELKGGQA